jgi:hypothetical protein
MGVTKIDRSASDVVDIDGEISVWHRGHGTEALHIKAKPDEYLGSIPEVDQ